MKPDLPRWLSYFHASSFNFSSAKTNILFILVSIISPKSLFYIIQEYLYWVCWLIWLCKLEFISSSAVSSLFKICSFSICSGVYWFQKPEYLLHYSWCLVQELSNCESPQKLLVANVDLYLPEAFPSTTATDAPCVSHDDCHSPYWVVWLTPSPQKKITVAFWPGLSFQIGLCEWLAKTHVDY